MQHHYFYNAQCNIAEQHIRGTHFSRWSTYNSRRWLWATAKFSAQKYETLRKYSAMQTYHKWQNVAIINNRIVSHRAVNNPQHDTAICGMVLWHRTVSIRVSLTYEKIFMQNSHFFSPPETLVVQIVNCGLLLEYPSISHTMWHWQVLIIKCKYALHYYCRHNVMIDTDV